MMNRINKCLAIAVGAVGLFAASANAQPLAVAKSAFQPSTVTQVALTQDQIIQLKILQQVLRRQLVATVKLAYCQASSPSQPRCR